MNLKVVIYKLLIGQKKACFFIALALLSCLLAPLGLSSCSPPALSFEQIVISEDANKETNEPVNSRNEFDINSKQVFATIAYIGTRGADEWRFKWIYVPTGEIILDDSNKYNSEKPEGYFEGIIASNISTTDEAKIIPPGNYRVEFYHNGQLKQTQEFKVDKPPMTILEVTTSGQVDDKGAPLDFVSQFLTSQTVYACARLNYLATGNILKAAWKNEDNTLVSEAAIEITEDYYQESYRSFNLELSSQNNPINPGKYKVEIYLNDKLFDTMDFEVTQAALVTFDQKITYINDKFAFVISIPDKWTYQEQPTKDMVTITLKPEDNSSASFIFTATAAEAFEPFDEYAQKKVEELATEKNLSLVDKTARDYPLKNGSMARELMYLYQDTKNTQHIIAYTFIQHKENVYIFYTSAERESQGNLAQEAYYGILDSLVFK